MWRFVLLWVLVLGGSMLVVTSLFDYATNSDWASLGRVAVRVSDLPHQRIYFRNSLVVNY